MTDAMAYTRSVNVIATELDGEILLVNTESWVYFEFDPIGSAIWRLLEKPTSLPALVDALMQCYAVERAQCERDTKVFLDEMLEQGVVIAKSGGAHDAK